MALSNDKIAELLAGKNKQSKLGKWCTMNGEIIQGRIPPSAAGAFIGKAGSIRRSSKGRTVRNLDGSRKYIAAGYLAETAAWYIVKR